MINIIKYLSSILLAKKLAWTPAVPYAFEMSIR